MDKISQNSSGPQEDRFFRDGHGDAPDGMRYEDGAGQYEAAGGAGRTYSGESGEQAGNSRSNSGDCAGNAGSMRTRRNGQYSEAYYREGSGRGSFGYSQDSYGGREGGYAQSGSYGVREGEYAQSGSYGRGRQIPPQGYSGGAGQIPPQGYPGGAGQIPSQGYSGNAGQIPPQGYSGGAGQVPPQGYSGGAGQIPPQGYPGGAGQVPPQGYPGGTGQIPPQGGSGRGTGGRGKKKRSRFGDVISGLLMLVALAIFLYSGYTLYGFYKEYKKGTDEYDNLENNFVIEQDETEDLAALEDEEARQEIAGREVATVQENGEEKTVPVMYNPIDFDELKAVNEDIVGWLKIRALDISYPIVQAEDNDYYLHRTFEKTDNFAGCIFMNCDNKPDLTDQNTIIYGHNMKNGSMFGKLKKFNEEETFDKSGYFWIFAPDLIYQYQIFSAMTVSKVGLTYQTFFTDEEYDRFVSTAFENSVVDNTGMKVTRDDRIVTLSTCTGDDATRFVVMGRLAQVYAAKR